MSKQSDTDVSRTRSKISTVGPDEASQDGAMKLIFIGLAISAIIVGVYIQVAKNISESLNKDNELNESDHDTLVVANNLNAGYLQHVIDTLLKFGHKLSFTDSITERKAESINHFDLIWSHDYPFSSIKKMSPCQRINHFPGTGFITNKLQLSTSRNVPHLLKAFRLPYQKEEYIAHSKTKPNGYLWIQKDSAHRGIRLVTSDHVDLESTKESIVQEYMHKPLLIDGKKFDIGIYAVLTSVEPIRAYIYEAEALLRFTAKHYLDKQTGRFNSSDIDSYVIGDDYTPIWLMPSFVRYYVGTQLSMKQSLNSYLRRHKKNGQVIWDQIEETIRYVYKSKEHHLARLSRMYQEGGNYNSTSVEGSLNQFFEMVRFDFIVDEDLQVYLMEANMSPNLSSKHFPPNRLLYEQVLASFFSLTGLTQFARQHLTRLPIHHLDGKLSMPKDTIKLPSDKYGLDDLVGDKELSVYEDLCVSDECHMNCIEAKCLACNFCLGYANKLHLRRAIYEELNSWNFKRILPSTLEQDYEFQVRHPDTNKTSVDSNFIHVNWFKGKCNSDRRFCSY